MLLLDEGNDGLAESIGRALLFSGRFKVQVLTQRAGRLGLRRVETVERDLSSGPALLRAVERFARDHEIHIVLPIQEAMIARAGEVVDQLRCLAAVAAIPSPDLLGSVHDKWRCRAIFIRAGIDVPKAWSLAEVGARAELDAFDRPVLLKPTTGRGGNGIERFGTGRELLAAFAAAPVDAGGELTHWMAEEYIDGTDVGVCLLAADGAVIGAASRRIVVGQQRPFRSAGLVLEYDGDESLLEIGEAFVTTSGWSGPADVDCRRSPDGRIVALEVNPRYWQTMLGPVCLGCNLPAAHCQLALDQPPLALTLPSGRWLNVDLLLADWRNFGTLLPRVREAVPAAGLGVVAMDPRFELDLLRVHARRQATTALRRARRRLRSG